MLIKFLKKWWWPVASILFSTTPPALVLYFQGALLPYAGMLEPKTVVNVAALLLWLILLLFVLILMQRPWLKWDEPTGTWINRINGLRYCGTCRAKKIIVPLMNESTGWRCVACGKPRQDPARKKSESEVEPWRPLDAGMGY